ncbi:493_t:CDS:1, partial [Funneliformis mosseae]
TTSSSNNPFITPDFIYVPSFNDNFVEQDQTSYMPDKEMYQSTNVCSTTISSPVVIYQLSGIKMQQDTTTMQFELVSHFVKTTVWYSTTYA